MCAYSLVHIVHSQTEMIGGLPWASDQTDSNNVGQKSDQRTVFTVWDLFHLFFISCIPNSMETLFRFHANCIVDAISSYGWSWDWTY